MFKEFLLNESEKKEFLILKLLYINSGKMSKKDLCKLNNISMPTLSTYINNIQYKFEDLISQNYMSIDKTRDIIVLSLNNNISLETLLSLYLKDSVTFKLLIILLENQANSNLSICKMLNISISTLNRKIKVCNIALKNFNLTIKNNKICGSEIQICYFYYSLIWNSCIDKTFKDSTTYDNFINFLEKNLNIKFGILEKSKINLLLKILIIRKSNFRDSNFTSNIKKIETNKIFILINRYYKTTFIFNNCDISDISYITFCFFFSLYILPISIYSLEDISEDFLPHKTALIIFSEFNTIYKADTFDAITNYAISNFVFRIILFHGYFYSVDELTLDHYLNKSQSKFRNTFSKNLFLKLKTKINDFNIDFSYFDLAISLILKYLNNFSNYIFHSKYTLSIGVLLRNDLLLVFGLINELNSQLKEKFDVSMHIYSESESYDLLITNLNIEGLPINYKYICHLTDLGIEYDLYSIKNTLNEIENNTIFKF